MPCTLRNRACPVIRRIVRRVPGISSLTWSGLVMAVLALAMGGCESSNSSDASGGTDSPDTYAITVYYTAVESFHGGAMEIVRGLLSPEGAFGDDVIGTYPASFIAAVQAGGTGRITSGSHAGKYLNWSYNVGYWLNTIPANAYGGALEPFQTAAADLNVLPRGARFKLMEPLIQDNGSPLDSAPASRFLSAVWNIQDQFTPGAGGARHLDLYIGEEDQPDFTSSSPLYISLVNVRLKML